MSRTTFYIKKRRTFITKRGVRKAAVAILILGLLDDDNGSERGKTREWIKKWKERGMFINMKELKMHDARGSMRWCGGPRTIRPNFASNSKLSLPWLKRFVWLDFQQLHLTPPSCLPILRPRTHGNVFLRFCIVYCSQGNREQPAHYLKQYKNAEKRFRVYGPQSRE